MVSVPKTVVNLEGGVSVSNAESADFSDHARFEISLYQRLTLHQAWSTLRSCEPLPEHGRAEMLHCAMSPAVSSHFMSKCQSVKRTQLTD